MATLFGLARVGRDAELRRLTNGDAVLNLSLAFNYGKKGDDGRRPTQWLEGAMYGARAEALAQYLTKGTSVAVSIDDVHIEEFKRADGTPGTKLVGRIGQLDLAGGGQRSEAPAPPPAVRPQQPKTGFDDMADDIPW